MSSGGCSRSWSRSTGRTPPCCRRSGAGWLLLELHAAAEEAIFYPALLQVGLAAKRKTGVEEETLDAIGDHNEIGTRWPRSRGTRSAPTVVRRGRRAKLANSDHMAEEEREGLTDFRRWAQLWAVPPSARGSRSPPTRNCNFAGVEPVDKDSATGCSQVQKDRQRLYTACYLITFSL